MSQGPFKRALLGKGMGLLRSPILAAELEVTNCDLQFVDQQGELVCLPPNTQLSERSHTSVYDLRSNYFRVKSKGGWQTALYGKRSGVSGRR